MNLPHVSLLCFSPTGTTKKTLEYIAAGIGFPTRTYDMTTFESRWQNYDFSINDLVLIGLPVYRGLIPPIGEEFFRGITAHKTPAVFVACYGNREYEDALLELKDRCEEKGFIGFAAVAAIGEHSALQQIATGRPDAQDRKILMEYGRQIKNKYTGYKTNVHDGQLNVPGKRPYGRAVLIQHTPSTNDQCNQCSICAKNCPVCAINPADVREIDKLRCITCLRCIHICPQQAKYLADRQFNEFLSILISKTKTRKEPELFL